MVGIIKILCQDDKLIVHAKCIAINTFSTKQLMVAIDSHIMGTTQYKESMATISRLPTVS